MPPHTRDRMAVDQAGGKVVPPTLIEVVMVGGATLHGNHDRGGEGEVAIIHHLTTLNPSMVDTRIDLRGVDSTTVGGATTTVDVEHSLSLSLPENVGIPQSFSLVTPTLNSHSSRFKAAVPLGVGGVAGLVPVDVEALCLAITRRGEGGTTTRRGLPLAPPKCLVEIPPFLRCS